MSKSELVNPIIQTYKSNAKIAPLANDDLTNSLQSDLAASRTPFTDFLGNRITSALEASKLAEQAPMMKHNGEISDAEYSMIMNEAQIQLAELKSTAEKSITALQEILRSTFT